MSPPNLKKQKPSRCRLQKGGGFQPAKFRWRVERTFAWLGQCRLLSKEHEKTVASAEAWLGCAMMRLLVRRLAV
ncbi:MAG: transposase [Rhodospirillales bacterium]|nr:transposase [Acetobacter sp.]